MYICGPACRSSCLVSKSCLTLCDPMDCSMPGFPVLHYLPELLKLMSIELMIPFSHLVLCRPFSCLNLSQNQGLFQWVCSLIRWPRYWSFSFRISPSSEYSGLISFRIEWFDLLRKNLLCWSLSVTNNNMTFSVFEWQLLWICHWLQDRCFSYCHVTV